MMTSYHFPEFIRRNKSMASDCARSYDIGIKASESGKGFTLVEMLISVALFSIIMLIATGSYLMMISLNRNAQNIMTGVNNIAFALESMTRNIRTGTAYACGAAGGDCDAGSSFSFINQQGATVTYSLSGNALQQIVGSVQSRLTDASVTITSLKFYVYGTASTDKEQPRVSIIVTGTVASGDGKTPQSFAIQTGATMRTIDL